MYIYLYECILDRLDKPYSQIDYIYPQIYFNKTYSLFINIFKYIFKKT